MFKLEQHVCQNPCCECALCVDEPDETFSGGEELRQIPAVIDYFSTRKIEKLISYFYSTGLSSHRLAAVG